MVHDSLRPFVNALIQSAQQTEEYPLRYVVDIATITQIARDITDDMLRAQNEQMAEDVAECKERITCLVKQS